MPTIQIVVAVTIDARRTLDTGQGDFYFCWEKLWTHCRRAFDELPVASIAGKPGSTPISFATTVTVSFATIFSNNYSKFCHYLPPTVVLSTV